MASNNSLMPQGQMTVIYIMYGGLILFFIYKQIKAYLERKKITGNIVKKFKKETGKFVYILGAMIIVFGVINIIGKQYLSGALMIVLVLVLAVDLLDSIIVSEHGIYGQGTYLTWEQIKKWGFDAETSELVASYKDGMEDKTFYVKVNKKEIEDLNLLIRKYKLGK